MLFAIDTI